MQKYNKQKIKMSKNNFLKASFYHDSVFFREYLLSLGF